jgi:hypothetical protein
LFDKKTSIPHNSRNVDAGKLQSFSNRDRRLVIPHAIAIKARFKRRRSILLIGFLFSISTMNGVNAQGLVGFKTPSKNIYCMIEPQVEQTQADLRCDIMKMTNTPPRRPADCSLSWGDAFVVLENGDARRICHGDTTHVEELPVLPYGGKWNRGGYSCRVVTSGLTCANRKGHGFVLSRSAQRLY